VRLSWKIFFSVTHNKEIYKNFNIGFVVKIEYMKRLRGACCLHQQGRHRPDDGDTKHLRNVGKLLPKYTAQHPRRQSSSYSPQLEPEISHRIEFVTAVLMPNVKQPLITKRNSVSVLC
jgi:hypothetical protein